MFKHSCFIENSEEALVHLENIGYPLIYPTKKREDYIQTQSDNAFITDAIYRCGVEINCIGNLPLFKALTAVRDDNDYMQWFVCSYSVSDCPIPKGEFRLSTDIDFQTPQGDGSFWKKATKEELIEKFKK